MMLRKLLLLTEKKWRKNMKEFYKTKEIIQFATAKAIWIASCAVIRSLNANGKKCGKRIYIPPSQCQASVIYTRTVCAHL